jgi:aryl-alcohol dehydrogenase-like predicted oxidoreductase
MTRRQFVKTGAAATALLDLFPATLTSLAREQPPQGLEKRSLGKTGEKLSILGFGGIVVKDATPEAASLRVREAIDHGVNYFDVAPSYGDAEERLGPALQPFRQNVFLACKTEQRRKREVAAELDRSLQRLRTDHVDLYQLHAVTTSEEVETILGPDGALRAFLEAKQAGKIRFLGFSAHSVEAALALIEGFAFDTILFPINYVTWHAGNFGPQVLARAHERGMGILALKAMAKGPWPAGATRNSPKCWYEPLSLPEEALLALRFTLSHPVTAAIPPGDENLFRLALALGGKITPLEASEVEAIKKKALLGHAIFRYPQSA